MIDIGKILKRAWHILWSYKVLWIFGILLAVTAGGGGGSNGGGNNSGYQANGNNGYQGFTQSTNPTVQQLNQWFQQNIVPLITYPLQHIWTFVWIGVGLLLFLLIVGVIFAFVRYVSETAVIRMVDEYEQTGTKVGFKQGWKLGWNRRAFRMWLIDLIIGVPFLILVAFLIGLGAAVFFSVRGGNQVMAATSIVAAIGCTFIFILVIILLAVLLGLLRQFFIRMAALENASVGDSFRKGWAMFKRNWKSAGLMWLVMLGIGIASGIAMFIIFFLLIPAYIILILPAVCGGCHPRPGCLRHHQHLRKRTPGLDPGSPGGLAVLLPGSVCPPGLCQRLVQDLRIQHLDPDLPGNQSIGHCRTGQRPRKDRLSFC